MTESGHPLLVWIDAQIPPAAARWIGAGGSVQASHVFDLGLGQAADPDLSTHWPRVLELLLEGENLVEISEPRSDTA